QIGGADRLPLGWGLRRLLGWGLRGLLDLLGRAVRRQLRIIPRPRRPQDYSDGDQQGGEGGDPQARARLRGFVSAPASSTRTGSGTMGRGLSRYGALPFFFQRRDQGFDVGVPAAVP